jgi:carboxyl-terminal processing protease
MFPKAVQTNPSIFCGFFLFLSYTSEDLPFNTALKFTVAKYYTPSGRCIQGVNYKEGGGLKEADGRFQSTNVAEKDRQQFYTRLGRIVKDGGGVEADLKVAAPKASALEITLLRSDVLGEFAAQWSRKNQLGHNFEVDDSTYREFQEFVENKREAGDIKLDVLYSSALNDLKRQLKQSGYKGSEKEVKILESTIIREIKSDFERYKEDIKEDIANSILARYLPESMLLDRGLQADKQFEAAVQLVKSQNSFDKILAKGGFEDRMGGNGLNVASAESDDSVVEGASLKLKW